MPIHYNEKQRNFYLEAGSTSYVIHIAGTGYLQHIYWGKRLRSVDQDFFHAYFKPLEDEFVTDNYALTTLPQEYPTFGTGDFRTPAFEMQLENGTTVSDLKYVNYKIFDGKKPLDGLPSCYTESDCEAQTLEIILMDKLCGLKAVLSYTVYNEMGVITRSVRFENEGVKALKINRALSASVDFTDHSFELLTLSGAWARETHIDRRALVPGIQKVESKRCASSPQQNPFVALLRPGTDEENGDVYAMNLVYSGSFTAGAEVDEFGTTRLQIGINPFDFSWKLESGKWFQTPEAVMVYSDCGLGKMSRTFHSLYRNRLCRGSWRDKIRPILLNSWEVMYFDLNKDKLTSLAKQAKQLGFELFVMDDGWFGHRNDAKSSLGDWYVDETKLPGGLSALIDGMDEIGIGFGIWVEPEMVSPDSDLYRAHPDWCIHVPDRYRTLKRNQLILDLSRDDVCEFIIDIISKVLSSGRVRYVKWDMNRNMTEAGGELLPPDKQREIGHRYILGLYRIMDAITSKFPDILFESCASGGGRFDPGMLYYMPQTWTSDNTDAGERMNIQYGTSLAYPAVAMAAHVSDVPNHQNGRITPLETRGFVAMGGNFGYEMDVSKPSDQEKEEIKAQIEYYKSIRHIVQFGDLYRLQSPYEGNTSAWLNVTADKSEAVVFHVKKLTECNVKIRILKLAGLDPSRQYSVVGTDEVYGGDELINIGLIIPAFKGDFKGCSWHLKAID
ncbi:MAG: alpha-galactosidase [Bacillota bacterium]|nr:alpha-galactosidase [Bacillota bacterium]